MSSEKPKTLGRKVVWQLGFLAVVAIVVAYFGITSRENKEKQLTQQTLARAVPTVDVVSPERGTVPQELVLPGEIQAWYTAPILARVNGYVRMWYKDYGAEVKAGDLLAEIDTPDLDEQLEQAKGNLAKSQANLALAEITAKRWNALRSSDAVSQQAADEKVGEENARKAEVTAAQANVARLRAMEDFKKITAPFDGVVTVRNIDVGALVSATPSGNTHELQELFQVSDIHKLRVYVQVPQAFAAQLSPGLQADMKLSQYPDRVFKADVATTSKAITQRSRSLLVELHSENKDELLQPGSFVEVHFQLPPNENFLRLPTSALIFRGSQSEVATVGADGKIVLKPVKVGRDLGMEVEILSGLSPSDRVVKSPSDSIAEGDMVKISGDKGASEPEVVSSSESRKDPK
ncbi:MAG: efflux RND transporter periplasmic adaptor subunit [Beijerinckiaceae bacterium]